VLNNLNAVKDKVEQVYEAFDDNQRKAAKAILDEWFAAEDQEFVFPIVDGPPGTGKTTLGTTAIAKYLLERKAAQAVYMCYTHFAAAKAQENLCDLLGLPPERVIRLHHNPERTDWTKGIVGCSSDLTSLSFNEKRRLKECNVLLCTLHGSRRAFKLRGARPRIIIDEFSQVDPPMFFATLSRIRSEQLIPDGYALLGDPRQLPIITTQPLLKPNIGLFIMRRKPYQPHELVLQHRMHGDICEAVNSLRRALNTYPIQTSKEVKHRDLLELGFSWDKKAVRNDQICEVLDPQHPFVIVDTDKVGGNEERCFGGSLRNVKEADLAARLANAIYDSYKDGNGNHLKPVILSPYSAQVGEIRRKLPPTLRKMEVCTTIYRSQGREYPCVIVSFVRNNPGGFIGFLEDPSLRAQTYVACSRAKGKLIVLLSRKTFLGHGHLDYDYLDSTKSAYKTEVKLD
jgi:hypothetical protein